MQEVLKLHDMEIVALLPSEIPDAYDKGDIDGAFVWGAAKNELGYKGASARGTCGGGRSGGRRWGLYPPSGRRLR